MAKGKHAVALFEVIHSAKKPQGQTPQGMFRTPKWWFKGRSRAADRRSPAGAAPHSPAADPLPPLSSSSAPASVHDPRSEAVVDSGARNIAMDLDRDHKQITFRVSFHSAIVTTFAVAMIVVVAFAVGRKMAGGSTPATAGVNSQELRSGPSRPDVLNVGGTSAATTESRATAAEAAPAPPTRTPPAPVETTAPGPIAVRGERVIGMQYIVIQSFLEDAAAAERTAVYFRENGIDCTVESGLPGWSARWHSVVGTQGFPRASGIDYERYFNRVITVGDKFTAARRLPQFKPLAYAWKPRKN
jgi:hypothetical protein